MSATETLSDSAASSARYSCTVSSTALISTMVEMMMKLVRSPVSRGNPRRHQQNDHERVAEPAEEFERQRQAPPLLQGIRAIAQPPRGGLGGGEAVSTGCELLLEIGARDLPEFPLRLVIRCHRQSPWSAAV